MKENCFGNMEEDRQNSLPPLQQIYFYLTEGCNLACRHCWVSPKYDADGRMNFLSLDLFERAIIEGKPLGLSGIKLTGGEPLMHPRFLELLRIARRENLSLSIETNGVLCTQDVANEIAKSHVKFVSVSIDGADARTHEWIRGVPGCFEKTIEGVRNLVSKGIRTQIIATMVRRNASQIDDLAEMAQGLGAESIKFNVIQPTGRGETFSSDHQYALSVEELLILGKHVETDIAPRLRLKVIFDYPYAFRALSNIAKGSGRCHIHNIIGVLSDGHYALCGIGYSIPEMIFGKVSNTSLCDIWAKNKILLDIRKSLPDDLEGICGACLMKKACMGSCIAQNYYRTQKLFAPYWFCNDAHKAGLFPKSRMR